MTKIIWTPCGSWLVFMVGLGLLFPVKGNINATAFKHIIDDYVLPQQFGEGPFLFQHDSTPTSSKKPFLKREGCYSCKGWTNSILMPIILDEMLNVGCPYSSGHVVYLSVGQGHVKLNESTSPFRWGFRFEH
uniref:Uncharacterized protein n=1 Tax=Anguilla anguilla TaxID=7936 RepID=A0A0E9WXD3_ANGAN